MTDYTRSTEIKWTDKATKDLETHIEYLKNENPQIAFETLQRLHHAAVQGISRYPKMGRPKETELEFRELVVGAYVIGYRVEKKFIRILGIHHHTQDRRIG